MTTHTLTLGPATLAGTVPEIVGMIAHLIMLALGAVLAPFIL